MSRFAERIAREYPLRFKPKEKEAFRLYLMGTLRELGYAPKLQSRETALRIGGHVTNVVAGDPETAKLVFVAHYDTPLKSLLPPLIMPTRPMTAFLYLALTPVLVMLGSVVLSFALTFAVNAPHWTLPLFLLLLLSALLYLRFGPAETRNTNDNSSGVAALLETAAALTPRYRGEVAFAFLDGGFSGMSGAKALRKDCPALRETPVINVNCVAEGDELLILPNKNSRWDGELLDAILESFENGTHTTAFLKTDGLVYYPSDNRAFRHAVAICACDKVKGFGRLIRPLRATEIDEEHLTLLKNGLSRLAARYQTEA
ncbi:MAG: M28 family peptidase [Oscillospiraceae bacterium]|nr:M28 family peptidase [Oscillospiraceae bacterium]